MNPLPDLRTSLDTCTWHHLFAIARAHGLGCSNRWSKQALLDIVHEHLSRPDLLPTIIPQLPSACYDAIQSLCRAAGSVPYRPFTQQFGQIRPYRPWRKEIEQPKEPWLAPASPLERLWYLGFVFAQPSKLNGGLAQRLYLPAEFMQQLETTQPQGEMYTASWRPLPRPGQPPDLLWHLAIYLSTAVAAPMALQHGRWPSPSTLATLIARMGMDQTVTFQPSRSERRMPYLAFLHFLADAAGFVVHSRHMQVTPVAWAWLQSPPSERLRTLWLSLTCADVGIATPYAFPWLTPTAQGWSLLRSLLATLSTHHHEPLSNFITAIQVQDRLGHLADGQEGERLAQLLTQPLQWLGIVDIAERVTAAAPSDLGLRLTPSGAWLLAINGWDVPPDPPTKPAVIRRGSPDTLHFAPDTAPAHLARVASYTTWASPDFPDVTQRLTLDGERIGRAVAAGVPPAQIIHVFQEALARPLSRRQGQLLRKWAKSAQQATVRTVTVLETADATLMGKLRSRRHSRALIGAPLSPTRSEINPEYLAALLDNLATQGIFVSSSATTSDLSPDTGAIASDAGLTYLALRLLLRLGAHIPLPVAAPYMQIDDLRRTLNQDQLAAAELHVQTVMDEIESLLSGYLRLPAWRIQVDGKGVWLRLQRALANNETITIRYWNAEHNTPTERRITPYYIETHRHVRYLRAYCHLRQEERTFRVDRIECVLEIADCE